MRLRPWIVLFATLLPALPLRADVAPERDVAGRSEDAPDAPDVDETTEDSGTDPTRTADRITSFESLVTVNADRTLDVTETLRFEVTGDTIHHGIARDLPIVEKLWGLRRTLGFELVGVTRDGAEETVAQDVSDGVVHLRIGRPEVTVEPGPHTWELRYRVDNVLRGGGAEDLLAWNVTGNAWTFRIDHATARVRLPGPVPEGALVAEAWSGRVGEQGGRYRLHTNAAGFVEVESTGRLAPGEGLTVRLRWPVGLVAPLDTKTRLVRVLSENVGAGVLLVALLLGLLVHLAVWSRVGRDPLARELPARSEPPELSPGAVRYLARMSFDEGCFTSTLLGLAAKGQLRIDEADGTFTITQAGNPPDARLARDERAVLKKLFAHGPTVEVSQGNRSALREARTALETELKAAHVGRHFRTNARYVLPGLLATTLAYLVAVAIGWREMVFPAVFLVVWLTIWSVGVSFLVWMVITSWRDVARGQLRSLPQAIFMTVFSLPFLAGEGAALFLIAMIVSPFASLYLVLALAMHLTFLVLLRQRTPEGRRLLDEVDAYRRFLVEPSASATLAMNERHLAYGVALDLGDDFARRFEASAGSATTPSWYSTSNPRHRFAPLVFASDLTSSVSSATVTHSSGGGSSSFGSSSSGGFSGGGSGGGGGSGW